MGYVYLDENDLLFVLNQLRMLREYQPVVFDDKFIKENVNSINKLR